MARLGDICTLIRNGANIKQGGNDSGYPITRIETISNRIVDRTRMGYAGITDIEQYKDYVLQNGDILMSHINSEIHLGKTALYEKADDETIIHGMNLLCLRPNTDIVLSKYAFYYLSSDSFLRQIPRITKKSVNQASFNVAALKELQFPVVTMEQQQHIAAVLDKVSELIDLRKRQLSKLDELVKSRFIEMFGDPITNPKGFPIKTIDEVSILNKGITYSPEDVADEGMIVLRSSNIKGNDFDLDDLVKVTKRISPDKYVQENDILMCNRNGSARLVGKVAMIPKLEENMTFGTFMTIVRSDIFEYLFVFFQMDAFRKQIMFQTAVAINQISLPLLASVKVPVPPKELIDEFATSIKQINKSKAVVQQSLDKLETLKKSLMQEYFG